MSSPSYDSVAGLLTLGRDNLYNGGTLCLFQNDITPNRLTVVEDFVLSNFPGYGNAANISFGDPFLNGNLSIEIAAASRQFNYAGVGGNESVFGWFFLDVTGNYAFAERLPNAAVMNGNLSSAIVTARLALPVAPG